MRILHIITSLNIGGAEKLMVDLLPRLKEKGVEVELLLFLGRRTMFYDQLEKDGVKIHSFSDSGSVYNPKHIFRLYRFLKKNKFDIIHTHNSAPQIFTALISLFLSLNLVTTEHNTTNRRRNWKLYKVVDQWMYGRYKRVICISKGTEFNLRKYLNETAQKYITIYNGVDIGKYENAKATHICDKPKCIITMVAAFRPQKDQDTLIKALSLLPTDKFVLWLVGDGVRREQLEMLVVENGLTNVVKFWGIRQDIPNILRSSDITVMSSHYEGFGLTSVEGMASGKPFIASDVDGLREVVEGAGFLFKHGDHKQLSNIILELTQNADLYNNVAEKCLHRARQYDISKMVDGYMSVYQNLLT